MSKLEGKLTVLLPAYNEGSIIFKNSLEIAKQVKNLANKYEVIVIDDGSSDDTAQQAQLAADKNPYIKVLGYTENRGKGHALCVGTEAASGEYIAFCDSDLDLAPAQLEGFICMMEHEHADVVIGSKMHPDSKVDYPRIRRVYSWGYYLLLMVLFHLHVKDTQTGLKLFKAEVIKPVMQRILVKRFAFDIEVLAIINSRGYKIVSAPINVVFQRGMYGRIGWADIRNMLVDTLAVFYRLYILHYYDSPVGETANKEEAML
ncbi:MAG: glycosyltransferase family 2 protein [Ruthenibacterium sp.]